METALIEQQEIIRVTQLPIIEERLRGMKQGVEAVVQDAMALACTDDTVQAVKAKRAELSKQFAELETRRKAVKAAILGPYDKFEATYKECVSDLFRTADTALRDKIASVESDIKKRCESTLREYFNELCTANNVDFITFEQSGIKIDMASAKAGTPKKLMEQLAIFVTGVSADVYTLSSLDNAAEILTEYKQCLNATQSIATVEARHKRIEAERVAAEDRKKKEEGVADSAPAEPPVEAYTAPKRVQKAEETLLTLTFSVTDTKARLRLIKRFLDENGYHYN